MGRYIPYTSYCQKDHRTSVSPCVLLPSFLPLLSLTHLLPLSLSRFFRWQKISDPESIAQILKQVYADHSTNVDDVFSRILEVTKHPAAAASFASIMCAPQGQLPFKEALSRYAPLYSHTLNN